MNYNTDDLAHSIPESLAWASTIESFSPGDLFFIGANHQGLGPIQEGDNIDVEIEDDHFRHNLDPKKEEYHGLQAEEAGAR